VKSEIISAKFLAFGSLLILITTGAAFAQDTKPLSLAEVMTALQSTSSSLSLSQKNSFIKLRVEQRGVTFSLSKAIEDELKTVGATTSLISSIRNNGPQANQTATTTTASKTKNIKFTKLWVEQNITRSGRTGMVVHTSFTAYNLNGEPLRLSIRFQDKEKVVLRTANKSYANPSGQLALFKNFKPGFDAAVYKDWAVFVPYTEFALSSGTHNLEIIADVIYPDEKLLKHLTRYPVTVTKTRPSLRAPRAVFDKMWVDYGVTEGGLKGMRIHAKLKTYNLKDVRCYLKIIFEKDNGERLVAKNTLFADDRTGAVTLFSELTPGYATAVYNDVSVFMPYSELGLPKGEYKLRMHADLTYPDGGLIKHLNFHRFRYKKN
jgi:hypothetical protein